MNGYFNVVVGSKGNFITIIPPTDDGKPVSLQEIMVYLNDHKINFDLKRLNDGFNEANPDKPILLNMDSMLPISGTCSIILSQDKLTAVARFYPPSNQGKDMTAEDIKSACRLSGISYGIKEDSIERFIVEKKYCTDYVIAQGDPVTEGRDAEIEYFFNTDNKIHPTLNEDGTVDFFHLNIVNHCKEGEILAKLTPAVPGKPGKDIKGAEIRPRDVKRKVLKYGLNIDISEDKCVLTSKVNGHVTLTNGTVFVSDVLTVVNVDNSTGNIDYDGSVVVQGNVNSNFVIKAKGDVEVKGAVEGAVIETEGNILLARGIKGMGKGTLKAGGNIISKFMENCTATAGGYIDADAILHSNVSAGTEIHVMSRKGFITGGTVQATSKICVKTLGSAMGADTRVTVGLDTKLTARAAELSKEMMEIQKNLKTMLPVLDATKKKLAAGIKMTPDQVKNVQQLAVNVKTLQDTLNKDNEELMSLKENMTGAQNACVEVMGEVYPGTVIAISDLSMIVKDVYKYCRFSVVKGDVRPGAL
ncbi:hypothetical protein SAMN02910370_01023 [Lachnospiraceae bacterium XPB1003]|nr:hypothetical protein SAMN02910370_01023 [Lachnospiraceae bacterium XPB1003]